MANLLTNTTHPAKHSAKRVLGAPKAARHPSHLQASKWAKNTDSKPCSTMAVPPPGITGKSVHCDGSFLGNYGASIENVTWGDGLLLTGSFTADQTTQKCTIETFLPENYSKQHPSAPLSQGGQVNAIVLHTFTTPTPQPKDSPTQPPKPTHHASLISIGSVSLHFRNKSPK
ncbi:hypothetical protein [Rubritalea tangerina]|uniref:hypothetical protein n=1 Tax=Rubritalea tangerina TaxID=430798 RepID=UPI0036121886